MPVHTDFFFVLVCMGILLEIRYISNLEDGTSYWSFQSANKQAPCRMPERLQML